ncbi:MAG: hypothetical protein M3071_22790, partial [Actinomycetota bacterium]|nr:hypothetical protein [Actinomycetota bacterium]
GRPRLCTYTPGGRAARALDSARSTAPVLQPQLSLAEYLAAGWTAGAECVVAAGVRRCSERLVGADVNRGPGAVAVGIRWSRRLKLITTAAPQSTG